MRKFNPEKELKKIQHGNKNKIILFVISLLVVSVISYSFALYQVRYSKRIIYTKVAPFNNRDINLAIFVDGKESEGKEFPSKGSGYYFDKVECDNGSSWEFDNTKWKLILAAGGKDKCNVYFTKDYRDDSGANHPELYQGLIPITFDENRNMKVADITDNWYDYDESRWANAVLVDYSNEEIKAKFFDEDGNLKKEVANQTITMSDILQMYVWIPRYKYELFNANNGVTNNSLIINIKFEQGIQNTGEVSCTIESNGKENCTNAINGNWYTHPAFTFGDTELSGIWVGKFESSGTPENVTIKPNLESMINTNLSDMFEASRNIEEVYTNRYNLNKEEVNTHMMKNMEWGAFNILTQSLYGECNGGCISLSPNTNVYMTGYDNTKSLWNTANGVKASTTKNVYGVYDAKGGALEYLMANMVNPSGEFYPSLASFSNIPEKKYYDRYEYSTNIYDYKRGHLGDMTREILTTLSSSSGYSGVNGAGAWFPENERSWFRRGGDGADTIGLSVSHFGRNTGEGDYRTSFRVVITAEDK